MARKWSQDVTEHSDALDVQSGIFASDDPKKIAASLKKSAEQSHRRKSEPYRSAMSMLVFFINRAGKNLPERHKRVLEAAKDELRALYGKPPARARSTGGAKRTTKRSTAKRTAGRGGATKRAAGKGGASKGGAAKRSTAKSGSAKRGTAKRSTAKRSTAKRGTVKSGTAKRSTVKRSTGKSGAAKRGV